MRTAPADKVSYTITKTKYNTVETDKVAQFEYCYFSRCYFGIQETFRNMPNSYRNLLSQLRARHADAATGMPNRQTCFVFISLKCSTEELYINRFCTLRTSHLCLFFHTLNKTNGLKYQRQACGQLMQKGSHLKLLRLCYIIESEVRVIYVYMHLKLSSEIIVSAAFPTFSNHIQPAFMVSGHVHESRIYWNTSNDH